MNVFRKIKVFILCLTALICVALSAQERRPVAVLEPFTKGPVTSLNKNTVRGAINSFLVKTGAYKVVDRARTEQILQEQRFQRSQLGDSSKARSLGKLLGADLICISELIKEEGYFNAELSIIDVEIGEVTNAAYKLIAKDDPIAIDGAIREAMAELLGIKIEPPKQEANAGGQKQNDPTVSKPVISRDASVEPPPVREKAMLYIYTNQLTPISLNDWGDRLTIWVNDKRIGLFFNNQYKKVELSGGNYKILGDPSTIKNLWAVHSEAKSKEERSYQMNIEAGKTYYICAEMYYRNGLIYPAFNVVSESEGKTAVSKCKLLE